jgi:hypothetical protein
MARTYAEAKDLVEARRQEIEEQIGRVLKSGEPAVRSCWKCNPAHRYTKDMDYLIYCFMCGKLICKGKEMKC